MDPEPGIKACHRILESGPSDGGEDREEDGEEDGDGEGTEREGETEGERGNFKRMRPYDFFFLSTMRTIRFEQVQ